MPRAVIDPGVLIAAVLSAEGAPAKLLRRWLDGVFELIVSPHLLDELETVLRRDKFRRYLSIEEVVGYVALLRRLAIVIAEPEVQPGLTADPADDYIVAVAQASNADFIVSGDAHLLEVEDPEPPVLTPGAFLDRIPD